MQGDPRSNRALQSLLGLKRPLDRMVYWIGRRLIPPLMMAPLLSCTAFDVVTHTVDTRPVDAPAGTYTLDPRHYSVLFDVDHLHYIRFVARFDKVRATLHFEPEWVRSSVDASIAASSVDTNVPILDKMLAGDAMFDAADYPEIIFRSRRLTPNGPNTAALEGTLTIRDRTIPVRLQVTFNGAAPDPLTHLPTMGFSAHGQFSRAALGLATWYPAVGDAVNVDIQAEFVALPTPPGNSK